MDRAAGILDSDCPEIYTWDEFLPLCMKFTDKGRSYDHSGASQALDA